MDNDNMNLSNVDRTIRVLLGFGIFFWGLHADSIWGFAGFILIFSGLFGYSPIYALLKFDSRTKREKMHRQAGRPKTPVTSAGM